MMHEKLGSKSTHSLYTFIESEVKNMKKLKWKKWQNKLKNHIKSTCTSADLGENMRSFKKLYEKMQSHGTHCLYIWGQ